MTKTTDALRELRLPGGDHHGIINGYDVMLVAGCANLPAFMLVYNPQDNGRGGHSAYWSVHHLGHKTDPGGHWMHNGNKAFDLYGYGGTPADRRAAARDEAIAWTNERYGTSTWGTIPGLRGYLFPAEVVAYVKAELRKVRV